MNKSSSNIVKQNFYKDLFRNICKKKSFIIPLIILFILYLSGFFIVTFINEENYMAVNFDLGLLPPSFKYPFGTNDYGQNQFYQILVGCYNTLNLAIIATFFNLILGIIIGIAWGNSPKSDYLMIFIKSIFDNIPLLFFYIIIINALGNNAISLLIVVAIFGWVNIACLIRNNLLLIRNKDYNVVSKLFKTAFKDKAINNYLPSLLPIIYNSISISISEIIAFEITVAHFGFSIGENSISLSKLLYTSISTNSCFTNPYLLVIPLIFIIIINLCFYYIGKTISDFSLKRGDRNV